MKSHALMCAAVVCLAVISLPIALSAQTVQTVLASASNAFSGGKPVSSVTLSGTAQWIAGGDKENGNATLIANADGSFNVQLQLSQGTRTEAATSIASGQTCSWSGVDGVTHQAAGHNCMTGVTWFLPHVALFGGQDWSTSGLSVASASSGQFVDVRKQKAFPSSGDGGMSVLLSHLGTVEFYLDKTTFLPSIATYNIHPDGNAASDIPVQILYTNYQAVNGVALPFRIQRYMNGVLNLDITISQATTN